MGLVIWHGNESTHLCGLLVLLNTLSFPMKNRFLVPQPRMYTGTRGIFFTLKIYMSKNNNGACHRPHIMAGRRLPFVLSPRLCLFPRPAPALFICWFVCWLLHCHPKRRVHAIQSPSATTRSSIWTPSNLPPPPPRVVYLIIVKLYINMKSYDYMISYPPPTSFIVENEQLFKVTRHIMIQSEQLETKDGEWKGASRGGW